MKRMLLLAFSLSIFCAGCRTVDSDSSVLNLEKDDNWQTCNANLGIKDNPCFDRYTEPALNGFPLTPDVKLTPGSLCEKPVLHRYGERIAYCDRMVGGGEKDAVKQLYSSYPAIPGTPHNELKIDHLIPLCVGGSNEHDNLWPQILSVGKYSDTIEPRLCLLMAAGRMKQAEAVELIKKVKWSPEESIGLCKELDRRISQLRTGN